MQRAARWLTLRWSIAVPEFRVLNISQLLEPPLPVRANIDPAAITDLADSIRRVGILQPLIVAPQVPPQSAAAPRTPGGDGSLSPPYPTLYEIVAGHRRYLAARQTLIVDMPCMIFADPEIAREAAMLHENIYRADLNPAEEAVFFAQLIEKYDCTEDQLCKMVQASPGYVNDRLALLRGDQLVFDALMAGRLTATAASELNRVNERAVAQTLQVPLDTITDALKQDIMAHRRYLLHQAVAASAPGRVVHEWVESWKLNMLPPPVARDLGTPLVQGGEPVGAAIRCLICGGERDPQNMKLIYIHWYELEALRKVLTNAGMEIVA